MAIGHNRFATYAQVALTVLKAFELDNGEQLL